MPFIHCSTTRPIDAVDKYLREYPGLLLGTMAAAGTIKIGALLWQEKLSTWPMLHVLVVPLAFAGLVLGLGIGHDRLVTLPVARRLASLGACLLAAVPLAVLFLGPSEAVAIGTVVGPAGSALVGLRMGHPRTMPGALLSGDRHSPSGHVEV